MEKPPSQIESIESLGTRIEEWRQAKTRRAEPMPQALWDGAVALADVHGVYATSRELRLNYDHLKKRLESGGSIESSPAEPFVEICLPSQSRVVVELFGRGGARMRIDVTGSRPLDLSDLAATFWSHEL